MKRQWSEEEKIKIVKSYEVSGLSSQTYADREGLAFSSLRRWIRCYGGEEENSADLDINKKPESLSFVELLGTVPERVRPGIEGVEIIFPSQLTIKLQSVLAPDFLEIVKSLK